MTVSIRSSVTADTRCYCGGNHLLQDHWEFLESMPIELVGLRGAEHRHPHELSGGMK